MANKKNTAIFVVMKSPLNVTFLGTGTSQGIPIIGSQHPVCLSADAKDKRLRVSILIEWGDYSIVIDCGPDFRAQMLREKVSKVDAILITHEHSDHTAGIDDIRPFYFKQGDIPFYASSHVFQSLYQRFGYIFEKENKYPGAPTITETVINKDASFNLFGKEVTPVEVLHNTLPVLGFRIENFAYLTDVKTVSEAEMLKLKNLDVLVVNALQIKEHRSHLNLAEALVFIKELHPKKAYLTHISHHLGFHAEIEKELPDNVHLSYDGLKLKI